MANVIKEYVGDSVQKTKFTTRWWTVKDEDAYKHIFETVSMLENRQNYRTLANIKHARLYSNLEVLGAYTGIYTTTVNDTALPNRLSLNVVKNCIDTVTSKIAKSKPRPIFLTEGGNWTLQKKAKNLTMFIDGSFDSMGLYKKKPDSFRDSGIFGTGATKFYPDYDKMEVCAERTVVEELICDDSDGIYGSPRVLFQRRLVNKEVLKAKFRKKGQAEKIEEAGNGLPSSATFDSKQDLVKVIEAWHLPSSKDANDGKHVICIDNCTLESEEWNKGYFPFSFDRWTKRILGFFGMGIAEELTGIQIEINKILKNIQLSMHLVAIPRVFVSNTSQVNLNGITNDIASIVKFTGNTPPTFYTPQAMAPDVYGHLWNLYGKAYEIIGVSQLSASSKKPDGLDSGAALREYQDVESDRFQIVGQRYEDGFLESALITIDMTKDLAKKGKVNVKVDDQGSMKSINFADIDLDESKYLMRMFPTSILPTQPAGKMQKIIEYTQSGFLDKETAMDLMDFPDIKAATDKILSPRKIVLKALDQIVDSGKYEAPEPYYNLALAQNIAQLYYMDAKLKGVPEDRLELLRTYIDDVEALNGQAAAAGGMPGASAAPQVDPMAQPQAAPVSDLLPIGGQ